ncbi:unnamed protein product [marine sediment metagenome]|uniref:Uncharacterized protein n=1 Tax=marine sediment metagenome TaxID=412755 RepID=X0SZQ5_9ZZZZ
MVGKKLEEAPKVLRNKSVELKKYLKDIKAVLEKWKFSIEESKDGMRIELHLVALMKFPKKK